MENHAILIFHCEVCFPGDEPCSDLSNAGGNHSVLVRSDGAALAFGHNGAGQCELPDLPEAWQAAIH
jgi:alpha-tubulin suppressor-like RCC1 family protein